MTEHNNTGNTVQLILDWHDAVNDRRIEEVLALTTTDVRVGGPRGSAQGHDILADWVGRAGIELTPRAIHAGGRALYVEQEARWPGNLAAAEGLPACTVIEVRDGQIAALLRYDTLDDALTAMQDSVDAEVWRDS